MAAGKALKENGYDKFDVAHTSLLQRAHTTLNTVLEQTGQSGKIPVEKTWRLNERHYGGLTGLDKAETAAKHGEEQVKVRKLHKLMVIFSRLIQSGRCSVARSASDSLERKWL